MKKYVNSLIVFIVILTCNIDTYSQVYTNPNSIMYTAKSMYLIVVNKDNKVVSKKPIGRNVSIFCDTFFMKYDFYFTNQDGLTEKMNYRYLSDFPLENCTKSYRVEGESQSKWIIEDMMDERGVILILRDKIDEGFSGYFAIDNCVLSKIKY